MIKQELRKWLLLATCCVAVIALLSACGPQEAGESEDAAAEPEAAGEEAAAAEVDTAEMEDSIVEYLAELPIPTPDFAGEQVFDPVARMNTPESLEGSGAFPDNYYTTDILHTGARGCMSCHADLYDLVKNLSPVMHVASPPTFGKPDDVKYCLSCHLTAGALTGPKFGDIMHAFHTNNELFTDTYGGNCWSCHAVDYNGEMALFDTIKYDATFVGFPTPNDDAVILWQQMRGFETGHMTGFDMVSDLDLEVVSE